MTYDRWKTTNPDDDFLGPEPGADAIMRYVPHHLVLDYARLGWNIADTLEHVCHGQYGVLMQWLCDCPCLEPAR